MTATPDPGGWPALLHRVATSWSTLLRLLVGVAVVIALITGALHCLGDVTVEVGPITIQHRQAPAVAPAQRDPSRLRGSGTRSRSAATTMSPPNTSAASSWNRRGSV
jgi:disulfide bond formation protein DsbB